MRRHYYIHFTPEKVELQGIYNLLEEKLQFEPRSTSKAKVFSLRILSSWPLTVIKHREPKTYDARSQLAVLQTGGHQLVGLN